VLRDELDAGFADEIPNMSVGPSCNSVNRGSDSVMVKRIYTSTYLV